VERDEKEERWDRRMRRAERCSREEVGSVIRRMYAHRRGVEADTCARISISRHVVSRSLRTAAVSFRVLAVAFTRQRRVIQDRRRIVRVHDF